MLGVHQGRDGKWYFWNETYSDKIGPYETNEECKRKSMEYIDYLDLREKEEGNQ